MPSAFKKTFIPSAIHSKHHFQKVSTHSNANPEILSIYAFGANPLFTIIALFQWLRFYPRINPQMSIFAKWNFCKYSGSSNSNSYKLTCSHSDGWTFLYSEWMSKRCYSTFATPQKHTNPALKAVFQNAAETSCFWLAFSLMTTVSFMLPTMK